MSKKQIYGDCSEIAIYTSQKIKDDITIDGNLDKPIWKSAKNRVVL